MRTFFAALLLLPLHAPLWRTGAHVRRRRDFSRSPCERGDPPQRTACRDPPAETALRSRRRPPLSGSRSRALALSASDAPSEFGELRAERRATPLCCSRLLEGTSLWRKQFLQGCYTYTRIFLFARTPRPFPAPQALKNMGPSAWKPVSDII